MCSSDLSPGASDDACRALTTALLAAHTAPEIRTVLDELLLSRFAPTEPKDFDVFLDRERAAQTAGYAKLA